MKWKKRLKQINELRAKHGKDRSLARPFPDLTVEQRTSPVSNRMGPPPILKQEQVKAILGPSFTVTHLHKGAYQVIPIRELKWLNKP